MGKTQSAVGRVKAVPRAVPEGAIPLVAVEGTAYECGCEYAQIVCEKFPGYRAYLDSAFRWLCQRDVPWAWNNLPGELKRLVEQRVPHMLEVCRGAVDVGGPPKASPDRVGTAECTSFGLSGSVTLEGQPISGQTKDTAVSSAYQYIVLHMRIEGAPTILVLARPGELLGYGFWSTGMSIFRNSLHSKADATGQVDMVLWGLLTLAGSSVHEGADLARRYGIAGSGNCLISDPDGQSLSVEFNGGGVSIVPARNGIATHANHPEGEETAPFEHNPDETERENSRYRMHGLWELLNAERGRLTPQKALMMLADHSRYPLGICRHVIGGKADTYTTAAVVAEPTRGRLHVVWGNPCCNWPVTHTL